MTDLSESFDLRESAVSSLEPVNILLVDDEPKNLMALESVLAEEDRRLMTAQTGEDALRWLLREQFAVVLLDVHMPGMDGFETATLIRQHVRSYATPIIFLTAANKEDAHVLRGYSLGAVDYIFKPLDVGILRSKVAVFVDLFRKTEQVRHQAELIREARSFLENLLESTTDYAIMAQDLDGKIAAWYEGAREHYGYTVEEMVGRQNAAILFSPEDIQSGRADALLDTARATGRADGVFEHVRRDGSRFTASVTVNVQKDAEGEAIGYVLIAKDITEQQLQEQRTRLLIQEQAARAEAEMANRRFALLAAASDELSRLLESDLALHAFARLTTHDMADACVIDLLPQLVPTQQTVVASYNPELERQLQSLVTSECSQTCLALLVERGQPALLTDMSEAALSALHHDDTWQQSLMALNLSSGLVVPIPAQHGTLGVIWLLRQRGQAYDSHDLDFAQDLARRVGLALDNVRLYQEAQEAIQVREEFLSVASHELRTPITGLRGQAQLMTRQLELGREIAPERLMRAFRVIDEQSDKLSRLVAQLLDVSRLQIGELAIEPARCDVARLVREVVARFQATNKTHSIELSSPDEILGDIDALRLEQIITNLIDNAIKYSPKDTRVVVKVTQATAATVEIAVRDWGPGIPAEHRSRIFERFHRADKVQHPSGMGLGLYISRQIAELHGGSIEVQAPDDGGSRFVVVLPLHGAETLADSSAPTSETVDV